VLIAPVWPDADASDLAAVAGRMADRFECVASVAIVDDDDAAADRFAAALRASGVDVRPWRPSGSLADALSSGGR